MPSLLDLSLSHVDGAPATSQLELAQSLCDSGCITSDAVFDAFAAVDRARFVPSAANGDEEDPGVGDVYAEPYRNEPISVGYGATISTPHHHALIAEQMVKALPRNGEACAVLDLGCGTGCLSEIFLEITGRSNGFVAGVDSVPQLLRVAERVASPDISFFSGHSVACCENALPDTRFDGVHVGFAVQDTFVKSLRPLLGERGGVVVAPVLSNDGTGSQRLWLAQWTPDGSFHVEDVGATMCQADMGGPYKPPLSRTERLEAATTGLEAWKYEFHATSGRMPTRDDIEADAHARELFEEFASLRRYGQQ